MIYFQTKKRSNNRIGIIKMMISSNEKEIAVELGSELLPRFEKFITAGYYVSSVFDVLSIGEALSEDASKIDFEESVKATTKVATKWVASSAGAVMGNNIGGVVGGVVGSIFGGVGAVPGAAIGSAIGVVFGFYSASSESSKITEQIVDNLYKKN
jgi:hypothetical protein